MKGNERNGKDKIIPEMIQENLEVKDMRPHEIYHNAYYNG